MKHAAYALCLVALVDASPGIAATPEPDIIQEWTAVVPPPAPPALLAVKVTPEKTALLLVAFDRNICNPQVRDRCPAAVPKVRRLLDAARDAHMLLLHGHNAVTMDTDIVPELKPRDGEIVFRAGPDKFLRSDLESILKTRGVTTIILAGTAGNGAVLFTPIGGVSRGFEFLVPVDAIPADAAYHEQFTIFEMADVMFLRAHTSLTRSDLIEFPN